MTNLEEKWDWKDLKKGENLVGSLKIESPFLELLLEITSTKQATFKGFEENVDKKILPSGLWLWLRFQT
jgi:hypothetical protein